MLPQHWPSPKGRRVRRDEHPRRLSPRPAGNKNGNKNRQVSGPACTAHREAEFTPRAGRLTRVSFGACATRRRTVRCHLLQVARSTSTSDNDDSSSPANDLPPPPLRQ